jgi:hypothetical protein
MNQTTSSFSNTTQNLFSSRPPTKIEMPLDVIIYGCVFYTIIFLIGVTGNLLVIYVLLKEKQLRSFTNYLLANLSIADLMVLFICVPSAFHDLFAKERWYLGKIPCYLISFIENCMGIASILSLFMITFERYYVICRPLKVKSLITKSHILRLIGAIWVISIGINMPFIFLTEYKLAKFFDKNTTEYKCVAKPANDWSLYYIVLMNFVIYFVIAIILLLMYQRISNYLTCSNKLLALQSSLLNDKRKSSIVYHSTNRLDRQTKRSNSGSFKKENSNVKLSISSSFNNNLTAKPMLEVEDNTTTITSNNNNNNVETSASSILNSKSGYDKYIKPRKQLIFMIMWVIVVFYVSLFPFKIWTLILMFFGHKPAFPRIVNLRTFWYINVTSRILFYINSSINPILYNSLSLKFRHSFRNLGIFKYCFGNEHSSDNSDENDNNNPNIVINCPTRSSGLLTFNLTSNRTNSINRINEDEAFM